MAIHSNRTEELKAMLGELGGRPDLDGALLESLYDELRRLAARFLKRERPDHTLQPTALVHEAYLRLARSGKVCPSHRAELLGWAARLMRQILINHARDRRRAKRGGAAARVPLDEVQVSFAEESTRIEDLSGALDALTRLDARKGRVVELRFFGGLTLPEIAETLGVGQATVERDWRFARAWLKKALAR
jgi:RNA polymerase sigma-70 factor (ECF subfamily)